MTAGAATPTKCRHLLHSRHLTSSTLPSAELVKKATVCTSNLCALVKESSDIAPFVPLLLPLLDKNTDHSIPDIRDASIVAKQKLLDGAPQFGAIRRNSAQFRRNSAQFGALL